LDKGGTFFIYKEFSVSSQVQKPKNLNTVLTFLKETLLSFKNDKISMQKCFKEQQ